MKRYRVIILLIITILKLYPAVRSSAFLGIGADARYIGMGRAAVASVQGPTAVYWNPANIVRDDLNSEFRGVSSSYISLPSWDINYASIFSAANFRWLGLGGGIIHYSVADIPEYNEKMQQIGEFNSTEQAIFLAANVQLGKMLNIGAGLNYIQHSFSLAGSSKSMGYGINYGLTFIPMPRYRQLSLAVTLNDEYAMSGSGLSAADSSGIILSSGIAWHQLVNSSILRYFTLSADLEQERHTPMKLRFGTEISLLNISAYRFFIRAGIDDIVLGYEGWLLGVDNLWSQNSDIGDFEIISQENLRTLERKITFGAGTNLLRYGIALDYSLILESYRSLHVMSLSYGITK